MSKKWTDEDVLALMSNIRTGKPKRTETSKKILIAFGLAWVVLMAFGAVLAWYRSDSSVLRIVATGTMSGLTAATGFYFWKARRENEIKLKVLYKENYVPAEPEREQGFTYYDSSGGRDISGGV